MPKFVRRKTPPNIRIERQIITGLIISEKFIQKIYPLLKTSQFETSYAKIIADWCIKHYEKYKAVIGKHIEDVFIQNKDILPDDEIALIQEFLTSISEEYETKNTFNIDYIADEAEKHFRLSALRKFKTTFNQLVTAGEIEAAETYIKQFNRPALPETSGIDPIRDIKFITEALTPKHEDPDIIMRLPGDLGKMVGPIERGWLMAVQAESGVGKTWWLWFFAQVASLQFGHDVLFFSMEFGAKKMVQRVWQGIAGVPNEEEGEMLIPCFDCFKNQIGSCKRGCKIPLIKTDKKSLNKTPFPKWEDRPFGYEPCIKCKGSSDFEISSWWKSIGHRQVLNADIAMKKYAALNSGGRLKRAGKIHMKEFPSFRYTIDDMIRYIHNLEEYEGFIPSVIITDYADKLKWRIPNDARLSIAEIWNQHKGLAQTRHCLVITASQSSTMRTNKKVGSGTWGETQEKMNVIDLGLAFNQTDEEQAMGILNIDIAKKRHYGQKKNEEVMVLQQLAIGRPYIDSCRIKF